MFDPTITTMKLLSVISVCGHVKRLSVTLFVWGFGAIDKQQKLF